MAFASIGDFIVYTAFVLATCSLVFFSGGLAGLGDVCVDDVGLDLIRIFLFRFLLFFFVAVG